ncbi:MAG: hydrogenase maturation protease [Deltaproteobacteria bacterium]|nr:hydrogenase maturation protease [Deltaproteobacteria bacterium]
MAEEDRARRRVLVIGFGNPGRCDDGLGPVAAQAVETWGLDGVSVDADYQLTVEDSCAAAAHETVVFIDAAAEGPAPFSFRPVEGRVDLGFSSHGVEPEAVLGLAREVFGSRVEGYVLGIRGYDFDSFGERLSARAERNLAEALGFLQRRLELGELDPKRGDQEV